MKDDFCAYLKRLGCPQDLAQEIREAGITSIDVWQSPIDWGQIRCDVAAIQQAEVKVGI